MQEDPAEQLVALDHDLVAVEVEALHRDELGPHDLERETGQREAALLVRPLARRLDDLGIHEHVRAGVVVDVVDEEALLHADLRSRPARRRAPRTSSRTSRRRASRARRRCRRRARPAASGPGRRTGGSCESPPRHRSESAARRPGSDPRRVDHDADPTRSPGPAACATAERVGERVGGRARPRARGRRSDRAPAPTSTTRRRRAAQRVDGREHRRRRRRRARRARRTAGSRAPAGARAPRRSTSAGLPLHERAHHLVIGLAGLHEQARLVRGDDRRAAARRAS